MRAVSIAIKIEVISDAQTIQNYCQFGKICNIYLNNNLNLTKLFQIPATMRGNQKRLRQRTYERYFYVASRFWGTEKD